MSKQEGWDTFGFEEAIMSPTPLHHVHDADLTRLVDSAADGLLCVAENGLVLYANVAARRLLGLAKNQLSSTDYSELAKSVPGIDMLSGGGELGAHGRRQRRGGDAALASHDRPGWSGPDRATATRSPLPRAARPGA